MKYPRIDENRGSFPIRWMCSALAVSGRGYRSWKSRDEPSRRKEDRRLLIDIRSRFEKSERTYGSPRVLKDLRELGQRTSKKRIARIMRENGIVAVQRRRFKITTQSGHDFPSMRICLIATSASISRTWFGLATSRTSGPRKAGSIWPPCWICARVELWDGTRRIESTAG